MTQCLMTFYFATPSEMGTTLVMLRGEIPKGKHFAKSNFEKIRVKVFETILVLEGLFCDVLMKIWCQKKA